MYQDEREQILSATYPALDVRDDGGVLAFTAKTTTPPPAYPNLNVPLMVNVLNTIVKVDGMWQQGVWRSRRPMDFGRLQPDERRAVEAALEQRYNPACGTPMCFAGWTTQIGDAPFTITARAIAMADDRAQRGIDYANEAAIYALWDTVLVERASSSSFGSVYLRDLWKDWANGKGRASWIRNQIVVDFGSDVFTKYMPMHVEDAAKALLGLPQEKDDCEEYDVLRLFDGNNELPDVVHKVSQYINGDVPPEDEDDYDDDEDDD